MRTDKSSHNGGSPVHGYNKPAETTTNADISTENGAFTTTSSSSFPVNLLKRTCCWFSPLNINAAHVGVLSSNSYCIKLESSKGYSSRKSSNVDRLPSSCATRTLRSWSVKSPLTILNPICTARSTIAQCPRNSSSGKRTSLSSLSVLSVVVGHIWLWMVQESK